MRELGPGGVLSEEGREMLERFRDMVASEVEESGHDPHLMVSELEEAVVAAEAGLETAGGDYERWAASGGVEVLQSVVDGMVPKFLSVVQGSMRRFVGPADHSERERREHTDKVLMTLNMLGGGLRRMS